MFYVCSMVAVFPPLLSDAKPGFAEKAGLGDRFHYWRGASGRRYLFTAVPPESLADYRSVAVIVADRVPGAKLAAHSVFEIGEDGGGSAGGLLLAQPGRTLVLVHFLAGTDDGCREVVADLSSVRIKAAA